MNENLSNVNNNNITYYNHRQIVQMFLISGELTEVSLSLYINRISAVDENKEVTCQFIFR